METLIQVVSDVLSNNGWRVTIEGAALTAFREDIKAQWWLGSRRVVSRVRCVFDTTTRTLGYQEVAKEEVKGMPPPTFTHSAWRQSGITVDITRTDQGPGGGGMLVYGQARRLLEEVCRQYSWHLKEQLLV